MSLPYGVYVIGDRVVRAGYRDRDPRGGEAFHALTDPSGRALLRDTDEMANLSWDGAMVVVRDQAEIDARIRTEAIAADDAHFERAQFKAILLVLLDEINILRAVAGLPPRTIQQAKNAYETKLDR